jgi:hypothetical protein
MVWLTEAGARRLRDAMPVWRSAHKMLATVFEPKLAQALADASGGLEMPSPRLSRKIAQS